MTPHVWIQDGTLAFEHRCVEQIYTCRLPRGDQGWTIESEAPLTLQQSVHCHMCNTHGFVREGRWVAV